MLMQLHPVGHPKPFELCVEGLSGPIWVALEDRASMLLDHNPTPSVRSSRRLINP